MRRCSRVKRLIVAATVLLGAVSLQAADGNGGELRGNGSYTACGLFAAADTVVHKAVDISKMSQEEYEEYLKGVEIDTSIKDSTTVAFSVQVIARAKGDRVLLRWAPDEFAPWYLANKYGYNVLRHDRDGKCDTLKKNILPYSMEEMRSRFSASDSIAGAAAQMLYGKGTGLDNAIGSSGAEGIMQVYEEQQTRFAYAMMMAEIRPDIATAMGLMFVDSTARKGAEYTYTVTTNIPVDEVNMVYQSATVKNVLEKPLDFGYELTDSIGADGRSMRLFWPMIAEFSTFDIECRFNGGEWKKLNDRPFITLLSVEDESVGQNIYENVGTEPGLYEYRICGYDSFGEKSNYSSVHRIVMPDVIPPAAPVVKRFYIDRPNENTVMADIIWTKNNIEPDLKGYNIYYFNQQVDTVWTKLNEMLLAPQDTIFRCEVTYLGTGYVTVVALDTLDNAAPSMPQELFVADFTPPSAPVGLEYVMSPTGSLLIKWQENTEPDVAGYALYFANDSTHTFLPKMGKTTRVPQVFDTLEVKGVLQKYTYYRVKAFDYSGNESDFSSILSVKRKNYDPPRPCRIDSVWQDTEAVYMRWFPSPDFDVERFYVYRHLQGEKINTLIKIIPRDSVKNGRIMVVDSPEPNRKQRYYYHIETMNETGITSKPSLETSFLFKGEMNLKVKINLGGVFRTDEEKVIVAWDISGLTPEMVSAGAYFCVYKKWEGDDVFRHIGSVNIRERSTIDRHMEPGDAAEYRVRLRTKDGRISPYSNVVKVVVPQKEESK